MTRSINFFFALFSALPVLAGPGDAGGKASLSGTVTDARSGQTIPGAEVYFPDLHVGAATDLNGHYAIKGLPAAKLLVKVSMMGYAVITETVDLSADTTRDFVLSESVTEMTEVVVTGTSKATELKRDPVPTTLVGRRFLRENPSTNVIDALAKVPGISAVSTGPNISKPYIRGLGGNRVLTLFDGIRQEGQQWGEEHGVEVDQFLIDRVEVVKGPASLMYGSDALAGVVNLLPARPVPAGRLNGSALVGYATNNKGLAASVNVDGNNGRLIYGGRASAKAASNYKNRYDGRVYGTKYQEKDLSAYVGINRSWGYAHLHASLYDNLQEVPDGSRDSLTRRFTYPVNEADTLRPIVDDHVLNSYAIATVHQRVQFYRAYGSGSFNIGQDRITAKIGLERSIRREYNHPQHPDMPGLYLMLNTVPFDLKYHFAAQEGWEATAGLNGMYQVNDAGSGTELLIPSYQDLDIGPFVHLKKAAGKVDISGGLRYDVRNFMSEAMYTRPDPATGFYMDAGEALDDTSVVKQFDSYSHAFSGVSGSMGMAWNFNDRLTLKANIGRGYRAPNAAEITSKGVHPGTGLMQLGDENLKPEFNLQEDLGFFYNGTHVSVSVEVFHNRISNYVYNEKLMAVAGGDSLFMQDGQAFPVFKFTQTTARLYGGELSADVHPHPLDRLHFENSLSFVLAGNEGGNGAIITDSTRYLPLIPPLHTNSELRYGLAKPVGCLANGFVKFGVQVFAAQHRFYGAYGTETATQGYTLLDAGFGADVVNKAGRTLFSFTVLGSNLANVAYQSNMDRLKYMDNYPVNGTGRSGIYGMGRNISLRIKVPFNLKPQQPMATH